MSRNIPKSLKGYSPDALDEFNNLDTFKWAFRDLWDHDEQRMNVLIDRISERDIKINGLESQLKSVRDNLEMMKKRFPVY